MMSDAPAFVMDFRVLLHTNDESPAACLGEAKRLAESIETLLKEFDTAAYFVRDIRWEAA